MAVCIMRTASALSLTAPMCQPPRARIETRTPVRPSGRVGRPAADADWADSRGGVAGVVMGRPPGGMAANFLARGTILRKMPLAVSPFSRFARLFEYSRMTHED